MTSCESLLGTITSNMVGRFSVIPEDGRCVLVTPFLYPDNTEISFAIEKVEDDRFLMSDEGAASDYAFVSGIGTRTIKNRIRKVGQRFNMETSGDELRAEVDTERLTSAVIDMITAIQDVGYLVYSRSPMRATKRFRQDVESFLTLQHHTFSKNVELPGKTGVRTFDYQVTGQGSGHRQLLLDIFESTLPVEAVKRAKIIAFDYADVQKSNSLSLPKLVVVVDDRLPHVKKSFSDEVREILIETGSGIVFYNERQRLNDLLAA